MLKALKAYNLLGFSLLGEPAHATSVTLFLGVEQNLTAKQRLKSPPHSDWKGSVTEDVYTVSERIFYGQVDLAHLFRGQTMLDIFTFCKHNLEGSSAWKLTGFKLVQTIAGISSLVRWVFAFWSFLLFFGQMRCNMWHVYLKGHTDSSSVHTPHRHERTLQRAFCLFLFVHFPSFCMRNQREEW